MVPRNKLPPAQGEIEAMAHAAFAALPEAFRQACDGLVIRIADFPTEEILASVGLDDPFALTGLYEGVALTEKSISDTPLSPDTVWLFRRPILEEWIARETVTLEALVAHVLVHEIAHHFGWSDADIAEIDRWWD